MRVLPIALAGLCWAATALAGPREEALDLVQRWSDAFAASDVDGITALFAPDALFLGTGSRTVVTDTAGIRSYFADALLQNRPRGAPISASQAMVLSDEVVVVTGLNDSTGVRDGVPFRSPGRVTFVVARRDGQWRVVHFHRSAMPPPPR